MHVRVGWPVSKLQSQRFLDPERPMRSFLADPAADDIRALDGAAEVGTAGRGRRRHGAVAREGYPGWERVESRGRQSRPGAKPRAVGGARVERGGSGRKWFRVRGPAGSAAAVERGCRVRDDAGGGGGGDGSGGGGCRDFTEGPTVSDSAGRRGRGGSDRRGGRVRRLGGAALGTAGAAAGRMRRRLGLRGNRSPNTTLRRWAGASS